MLSIKEADPSSPFRSLNLEKSPMPDACINCETKERAFLSLL